MRVRLVTNQDIPYNQPVSEREFETALGNSKESAAGFDMLTYSMIKFSHYTMKALILQLFNKIYLENTFPSEWRKAVIIPIAKPDKDSFNPEN